MAREPSPGQCLLCGQSVDKARAGTHLRGCLDRSPLSAGGTSAPQRTSPFFHLAVEGYDRPEYWLHLAMRGDEPLGLLDAFLRDMWLECCDHLSSFTIGGGDYCDERAADAGEAAMDATLAEVLHPGEVFFHDYDFGSTTRLRLRLVGQGKARMKKRQVLLLARNDPPEINCNVCGKPATQICVECKWTSSGRLCNKCARKHQCGEGMLLPVVNSPRMGVCGYTGPAE